MKHVEIQRETGDRLKRDVWRFFYLDSAHALRLSSFENQHRPTTRHKYRAVNVWDRYRQRRNTVENPPIPEDVSNEAVYRFTVDLVVDSL